jgi:hypothetical protein
MEFRAFISRWNYTHADFAGYEGCMNAVMQTIYQARYEEWVSDIEHEYFLFCTFFE